MRPINTHNDGYLQMKKPGTNGCQALVESSQMAAAFRNDSTPIQTDAGDWLLLADKQPSYGDVRPEQPGIVEQGDGTTGYRDTGISLPQEGYVEIEFVAVVPETDWRFILGQANSVAYFALYVVSNALRVAIGDSSSHPIGVTLVDGERYKIRINYDQTAVVVFSSDVEVFASPPTTWPIINDTKAFQFHTLISGGDKFSKQKIISVEIGDANGTPLHRWTAGNMYYDQIGNANAVAHGTLTQLSDPLGDQTFNERGYRAKKIPYIDWSSDAKLLQLPTTPYTHAIAVGNSSSDIVIGNILFNRSVGEGSYTLNTTGTITNKVGATSIGPQSDKIEKDFKYMVDGSIIRLSNLGLATGTEYTFVLFQADWQTTESRQVTVEINGVEETHFPRNINKIVFIPFLSTGSDEITFDCEGGPSEHLYGFMIYANDVTSNISPDGYMPSSLILAKLDGTAATDGQPLTYSGRAPHSVLLPNYSGSGPITNELMQFTDDGPLDQYLAGSGTENGQQFTFADVTDTANVITTSNGFSVWKTAPSVQSILEEICK